MGSETFLINTIKNLVRVVRGEYVGHAENTNLHITPEEKAAVVSATEFINSVQETNQALRTELDATKTALADAEERISALETQMGGVSLSIENDTLQVTYDDGT